MTAPFSRTQRALDPHLTRIPLAALGLAIALALAWSYWFFFMPLTLYQTSNQLEVLNQETTSMRFNGQGASQRAKLYIERMMRADFPPQASAVLAEGQTAWVYLPDSATRALGAIPAIVVAVHPPGAHAPGQTNTFTSVLLQTNLAVVQTEYTGANPSPFVSGTRGQAKIAVKSAPPAQWLLRALRLGQ